MNRRKFGITIILMILLLLCTTMTCFAQEEKYLSEQILSLNAKNPEENSFFQVTNMFPGDRITQYYRLGVSYTGTITVNFHAVSTDGDENLSEVLEIKVQWADTGELLYEGSLAKMSVLGQELSTDSKSRTEELTYEVTVGLSTSAGNEYQNKKLIAELSWWAEGDEAPEPGEPESGGNSTGASEPDRGEIQTGGSLTNPPTGDESPIFTWMAVVLVSIAVILIILERYRRRRLVMPVVTQSRRKLFFGIFLALFLMLGLGITSVALVWRKVAVEENLFQTGILSINLNDGQPVFRKDMFFEPGMVIEEDFTLSNEDSTCDVYYRLYFTEVKGDLAEVLQVEVFDGDMAIFEGTLAGMNGKKSEGADGVLREGETRAMTIVFRVPEDCGNVMQGSAVLFNLNADAVQTVNNPDGWFE